MRKTWEVYIFNLPKSLPDKVYQLWYVTKDTQYSAAVFDTDNSGHSVIRLELPHGIEDQLIMTAVTVEPKGGSLKPNLEQLVIAGRI